MEQPLEGLDRVGDARAGPEQEAGVDRVDALAAERGAAAELLESLEQRGPGGLAADHDHLGSAGEQALETGGGKGPLRIARHVVAAGGPEQVLDEASAPCQHPRLAPPPPPPSPPRPPPPPPPP